MNACRADDQSALKPKARLLLAGVQMKLSVIKNTGKGGGLTIPLGDEQGSYIAKFPSMSFPGVSENEYANLALTEAIGKDVPERKLAEQSEFEGIPEEFKRRSDGKVLLVKRFDRGADGQRIHIADLAQVFMDQPTNVKKIIPFNLLTVPSAGVVPLTGVRIKCPLVTVPAKPARSR